MSILSVFVIIPALMLLGLWLSKSLNQVRGVMVTGASCLLALSIWLTIYFIQERAAGNAHLQHALVQTSEHCLQRRCRWHLCCYASAFKHHRVYRYFCLLAAEASYKGVLPLVHPAFYRCVWLLYLYRPVHHVYVL